MNSGTADKTEPNKHIYLVPRPQRPTPWNAPEWSQDGEQGHGALPIVMSLIESNVRVDNRLYHQSYHPPGRGDRETICVRADEGPYALTAAELASIESSKTREKLKTKADHVRILN